MALPESTFFEVERHGAVAELAMNRPDKANGMSPDFWNDLPVSVPDLDVDMSVPDLDADLDFDSEPETEMDFGEEAEPAAITEPKPPAPAPESMQAVILPEPTPTKPKKKKVSASNSLDELKRMTTRIQMGSGGKKKKKHSVDSLIGNLAPKSKKSKATKEHIKLPQDFAKAQLNCVFLDEGDNVVHTQLVKVEPTSSEKGRYQVRLILDIEVNE